MKTTYALVRDLFIFFFLVFLVVLVWKNNVLVATIIVTFYALRWLLWPNQEDHIIFVAGAVLGSATEIIATRVGVWHYTTPTFLNIPLWLPFAWGFVSVLIVRITQCLKR